MKKGVVVVSLIFLLVMVAGCAGYGKPRLQSGPGETMTTQQLKEDWQRYHILATGLHMGVPSAIIFDRKDDGREIIGEGWWELNDYKSISETIDRIGAQGSVAQYYPRLWKILGPDDHLYGYMFTAWDHATMTIVDDKLLWVKNIPLPPFLTVD
jgi:hypothetical protein